MYIPEYEGYEALDGFTPVQLSHYRKHLIDKTKWQAEFIRKHIYTKLNKPLRIVEVGSGNGRLLISLANQWLAEHCLGIDLSESRTRFANKWAVDWQLDEVSCIQGNVLEMVPDRPFDLAVCITGCFQYFWPIDGDRAETVLSFMRKSAPYALFELYYLPENRRSWRRLPDEDKFLYLLDDYTEVSEGYYKHEKLFIARDATVDSRVEYLHYYGDEEFVDLLKTAGYSIIHWDRSDSVRRVVLAS